MTPELLEELKPKLLKLRTLGWVHKANSDNWYSWQPEQYEILDELVEDGFANRTILFRVTEVHRCYQITDAGLEQYALWVEAWGAMNR